MHDCLFRSLFTARWLFFFDFDEYVDVVVPPSLPVLLQRHAEQQTAWLSVGQVWYETSACLDASQLGPRDEGIPFARYRMRWPGVRCDDLAMFPDSNFCDMHYGRRKVILDPRRVREGG